MKNTTNYKISLQRYFKYCPHCGTQFRKKRIHGSTELVCPSCGFIFWQNSKPTASCCLVSPRTKEILLTKRSIQPFQNMWDVPGGFLACGELPERGVRRELNEELGITLPKKLSLLGVYMDTYEAGPMQVTLNFYYEAHIPKSVVPRPDDDVSDARWFPLTRLPKIAFANGRKAVRDLKKLHGL